MYGIKRSKRLGSHSVSEVSSNAEVEIRVDTTVATSTKQSANRPDIVVHDKKRKEIILIEVGITGQDQLAIVQNEKKRKCDVLANEMGAMHNCKTRTIPYVLTWDGTVTEKCIRQNEIYNTFKIQSFTQFIVLKKTLESIPYDYRRDDVEITQESFENVVLTGGGDFNLTETQTSVEEVKSW